jgi:hypothetical protein
MPVKDVSDFRFDAVAIFDRYGGVSAVARMLNEAGINVNVRTLRKQRERGVFPPHILASLLFASHKTGAPINLTEFLLERETAE